MHLESTVSDENDKIEQFVERILALAACMSLGARRQHHYIHVCT